MALLGRIFVVIFAVWVAALAAGVVFAFGVLGPQWHAVSGDAFERGTFTAMVFVGAVSTGAISLLPLAVLIGVAEAFKLRSLLVNVLGGVAILMFAYYGSGLAPPSYRRVDRPSAAAGAARDRSRDRRRRACSASPIGCLPAAMPAAGARSGSRGREGLRVPGAAARSFLPLPACGERSTRRSESEGGSGEGVFRCAQNRCNAPSPGSQLTLLATLSPQAGRGTVSRRTLQRRFQSIVAPEQFAVRGHEARRAEDTEPLRLLGLRA